ncbi:MAG: acyltransferase [Muribaculaceae bacterium]|mgnify:CR=1 FL=1|nr:acyltransferase [Muribaculaceae bacterium]
MSTATMAPQTQRKDWFDLARGILMVMLFVYHSEVYYGDGHSWSFLFSPFRMAAFFIISGYFFCRDWDTFDFSHKTRQVVRAMIVPYFVFTIVLLLPKPIIHGINAKQALLDILLFRASWFIIVIAVCQLVYGYFVHRKWSVLKVAIFTVLMFVLGYWSVLWYESNPDCLVDSPFLNSPIYNNRLPLCINIVLMIMPFFFAGMLLRKYERYIRFIADTKWMVLLCAVYLIIVITDHYTWNSDITMNVHMYRNVALVYIYAFFGAWLVMSVSKRIGRVGVLNYIGKNSIVFYFLNGAMLQITAAIVTRIMKLAPINNGGGYFMTIIVALVACAATIPVCWFINKYLPLIVGKKEAWQRFRLFSR